MSVPCHRHPKVTTVQGTVDSIRRNERPDGSEYWVLSIGGQRYSAWDSDLVEGVQAGDRVEFAFTNAGRYRNLTALKRLAPAEPASAALAAVPESLRIVRMNCLRTAAEMLHNTSLLPEQRLSTAIALAERLERHVLGQSADDAGSDDTGPEAEQTRGKHDR